MLHIAGSCGSKLPDVEWAVNPWPISTTVSAVLVSHAAD